MMPAPNGVQQGTLVLMGDSVKSHLFLATDSGITYTAAYLDLPPSLSAATDSARAAAIWSMLAARLGAPPLTEPPPLGPPSGTVQSAWFIDAHDVRLAAVVHLRGTRVVLLNSAVPEAMFGSPQRAKMLKFLRSIEFTG
ncbi:MAG: hypothetical protein IPH53_01180 [Flavobacteriales bacterium]|jgi:hypothetical protein|nr:hypothetical protein [Flavobacteriales bacterium]MBK7083348.1 hypothetical protein [Flavobacteriales bacterium]MBK7270160.1 hypothetical protein [Flavobacteriales bacterium]MBK7751664.1 hypothetical protein [Flavobacteriales bacterium]MBK9076399.1 hypothetical protein [Flavobacteriales bacterium]